MSGLRYQVVREDGSRPADWPGEGSSRDSNRGSKSSVRDMNVTLE